VHHLIENTQNTQYLSGFYHATCHYTIHSAQLKACMINIAVGI